MEPEEYNIEDYISPSDLKLLDVVCANLDAIQHTTKIFADRNSKEQVSAFVLGTLSTIIEDLTGVLVPAVDLMKFINSHAKEESDD